MEQLRLPIDFLRSQAVPTPGMQELRQHYDPISWSDVLLAKLEEAPPRPKTGPAIVRRVTNDADILERLGQTNGNRRERLLNIDDVAECVETALNDLRTRGTGWGTCFTDGGSVFYTEYPAFTTTVGVVFYPYGMLAVGIAAGQAHVSSPGRTWSALQPWDHSRGRPYGDWRAKFWLWAENPTVVIWGPPPPLAR